MKRKGLYFGFMLLAVQLMIINCSSSPPVSESYKITLPNDSQNCWVSANTVSSRAGGNIQLTVNTTSGYQLKSLTVVEDNSGRNVSVMGNAGSWGFTMPSSDVTVKVVLDEPIPLTKELLLRLNSEVNIKTLNYYISAETILKNEEMSELYSANDGAVRRQYRSERETITIKRGTSGLMTGTPINKGGSIVLGICFDETNENLALNFRENADGHFYAEIETDGEDKKIEYGSKKYIIDYNEPPLLLIQYVEMPDENSKSRVLRGRSIGGNNR
jgi:hypothetical protein